MCKKNGNVSSANKSHIQSKHNIRNGDPTDGKRPGEWKSGYPIEAWRKIWVETTFLFIILVCSFIIIFLTWQGYLVKIFYLPIEKEGVLKKYVYYASSGMCGGITFDIKYLYRSVARLRWHQDRIIWRYMSPLIAMTVAFIVGAMINATLIPTKIPMTGSAFVSIGFLSGYFADNAVGKMSEIATVIFGKSEAIKDVKSN